jgi:iron(III) transport system substrate-binding protein
VPAIRIAQHLAALVCEESPMAITRRQFTGGATALLGTSALPAMAHADFAGDAEKALYEAAKKEGELTWYIAHYNVELAEDYGRAFTAKYPGVKVNVVRTTAHVAYQRLTQELKAGGPQVDVFGSTDVSHCIELKDKGLLEKFAPANAATVIPTLQNVDPDGYFHTTSLGAIGITYNSGKVKPADLPKSWPDLIDPKWRNQVSVGHPAFSGYVGIWVWQVTALYGWQYFEKLRDNNPQIGRSIQDTLTMLRAGERSVAAGSATTALEAKEKGEPIDIIYPSDGTVVILAPSGIVKGAKHPNASKLLMEFMMSPQASQISVARFGESMHASVKPRGGKPLSEIKTLVAKPMDLLKGVPEIKEKWRDTFGI